MADFTIGGRKIPVPPLNLTAQRVALRRLPQAFKDAQPVGDPQRAADIDAVMPHLEHLLTQSEATAPAPVAPAILAALLRLASATITAGVNTQGDPDALIDAFLAVLEARLKTHSDPTMRLSAQELQDSIEGADEIAGLSQSMNDLLIESGFSRKGEPEPAQEGGAPALPQTPTPSSTGSLSPSSEPAEKEEAGA